MSWLEFGGEVKRRAHSGFALHPCRAAHQLGEPLADREPESGAAVLARGRRIDLGERLEQMRNPLARDTDSCVTHGDVQAVMSTLARTPVNVNQHLALVGELNGVAN